MVDPADGIQPRMYDVVRVDHFRGFEAYYSIPYGDATAEFGHWEKGPGMALFQALEGALWDEDSGDRRGSGISYP